VAVKVGVLVRHGSSASAAAGAQIHLR
jgi:hypothetical protein